MKIKKIYTIILIFSIISFFVSACIRRSDLELIPRMRNNIVQTAKSLVGKPYCFGGKGPTCFDCSGLVYYVYKVNGYNIPSTTKKLKKIGKKIKKINNLRKGDILIFKINRKLWHAGIYIGNGFFIHSPKRNARVREEELNKYWRKKFKMGRRII